MCLLKYLLRFVASSKPISKAIAALCFLEGMSEFSTSNWHFDITVSCKSSSRLRASFLSSIEKFSE